MKKYILHTAVLFFLPVILTCMICPDVFAQDQDTIFTDDELYSESDYVRNSPDTVTYRKVPDTIVDRLKQQKTFEYANDPAYWTRDEKKPGFNILKLLFNILQHPATRFFFYLAVAALAVFIAWRIIVSSNLLRKKRTKSFYNPEEDMLTPDASAVQLALNNAIKSADYRLAVRFLYLQTLYALNTKELIRFDAKTTNQEYLKQINSTPFASDFKNLMRIYEYVWYGEFFIGREQFDIVSGNFTAFQNRIIY